MNSKYSSSPKQFHYKGKVRDVYRVDDSFLSIVSDRISAFDHILPKPIPYKGQVLNQLAAFFLNASKDIVPIWLKFTPRANISLGLACEPIKLEIVVRNYLVGHAWREYDSGKRTLCGVALKDGMVKNQRFDKPIITPATKAEEGHDEDISKEEIIQREIASSEILTQLYDYAFQLFERGQKMADQVGLILVDTKYEFGIHNGKIYLIDEIHTPDSSRYFEKDAYNRDFKSGNDPEQLSKEFVREWLIDQGFMGLPDQTMPVMPDNFVEVVSKRYIALYERLTQTKFIPKESFTPDQVEAQLRSFFS